MSTIQELIDSGKVVLGKTKIVYGDYGLNWCIPQWVGHSGSFKCQREDSGVHTASSSDGPWSVYQETVEMEDRWLWAHPDGSIISGATGFAPKFYALCPVKNSVLCGWSKTSFPKEKK